MAKDSIHSELLAENVKLRKMLDDFRVKTNSVSGYSMQELEDKLRLTGILIGPGTWKGVDYTPENIKKLYDSYKSELKKLTMTADHDDKSRGTHSEVEWDETLKSIKYKADITDKSAIEDIKAGKYDATSLRSWFTPSIKDGKVVATDIRPVHNTLTNKPACKFSQVFTMQGLDENDVDITYYGTWIDGEEMDEMLEKDDTFTDEEKEVIQDLAKWTRAYMNDLSDSAFAYIEPGGKKDKEGKTVPRSLRHLPYKNKEGQVDIAHLQNALARLPQTNINASAKASAKAKLMAIAKKYLKTYKKKEMSMTEETKQETSTKEEVTETKTEQQTETKEQTTEKSTEETETKTEEQTEKTIQKMQTIPIEIKVINETRKPAETKKVEKTETKEIAKEETTKEKTEETKEEKTTEVKEEKKEEKVEETTKKEPLDYDKVVEDIVKDKEDPLGLAAELLLQREKKKGW